MEPVWFGIIVGICSALLTAGITIAVFYITTILKQNREITTNTSRLKAVEDDIGDLKKTCPSCTKEFQDYKTKMDIFWEAFLPAITKAIHSPEHKRRDELVDRVKTLDANELIELDDMLVEGIEENHDASKILGFGILRAYINTRLHEIAPFLQRRV